MRVVALAERARREIAPVRPAHVAAVLVAVALLMLAMMRTQAVAPDGEPFQKNWARTDKPVADGVVSRTWMWGPEANTEGMFEPYAEGHNNARFVQYYDKARMEITTEQNIPADSPWFVTNGLLVTELITGRLQLGDTLFATHQPAQINVAGDPNDTNVPTYATLAGLLDDTPLGLGTAVNWRVDRSGTVSVDPALADRGVTAVQYVGETQHTVASVFWEFMTSTGVIWDGSVFRPDLLFQNPYYATGYPLTEPYWTTVAVDGVEQDVLVQAFQRRVLTYTPGNPEGWRVEAGNVGQHYYYWRYTLVPGEQPTATATATATSTGIATTTSTVTSTATGIPTETATATATSSPTNSPTVTNTPIQGTSGYMMIETIAQASQGDPDASEEYIIIRNMQQTGDIQMRNWTLRDLDGHVITFPDVTVKAGFYITVYMCNGQNIIEPRYAIIYAGLCQPFYTPPDEVSLYDSFGQHIDTYP